MSKHSFKKIMRHQNRHFVTIYMTWISILLINKLKNGFLLENWSKTVVDDIAKKEFVDIFSIYVVILTSMKKCNIITFRYLLTNCYSVLFRTNWLDQLLSAVNNTFHRFLHFSKPYFIKYLGFLSHPNLTYLRGLKRGIKRTHTQFIH